MSDKKKKNAAKTLLKIGGIALGIGVGTYVIKEVKKEYDSTVDENNRLKNFINEHDFYKKAPASSFSSNQKTFTPSKATEQKKSSEQKFAFMTKRKREPTSQYRRDDGVLINEYFDARTGLTLLEYAEDQEDEKVEQA